MPRTGSGVNFLTLPWETEKTRYKPGVKVMAQGDPANSIGWDFARSPWDPLLPSFQSWCFQHGFVSSFILSSPAIPEFHKKLSLLAFWMKCTGPSGVYHTSADKMMKQLDMNFATTVNEECPGLAETGTNCCKKKCGSHQNGQQLCSELCFPTLRRSVWPQFQDLSWKLML